MPKQILPQTDVSHIAVLYARVSTSAQEDNGTSLDSQEEGCRKHCLDQGLTVLAAHRDTESGAVLDRPGLQAALDAIRNHQAGVLVAYAFDRLSRNQTHQAVILHQVEELAGAKIDLVTEKLDDTAQGRVLRSMLGFVAEMEREKIKERTSRGKRQRDALGRPRVGSTPPYGFLWSYQQTAGSKQTKIAYIPDPDTAPIVIRIFEEVASGKSLRWVARGLIADGVKTPSQERETGMTGGKNGRTIAQNWTRGTLQRFLHRECYRGVLVSEDLWQRAQAQLIRSKEDAARNTVHPADQLLRAGLAVCGYCGRPMQVKWDNRQPVYHCGARYDTPYTPCSGGYPAVDVATLDTDIWGRVLQILNSGALMVALTRRSLAGQDTSGQDRAREQIETHTAIITKLQRRRRSFYTSQADADEEAADFLKGQVKATSDLIASHEKERDQLQTQLEAMESAAQVEKLLARIPGGVETRIAGGEMVTTVYMEGPRPENWKERQEAYTRKIHEHWAHKVSKMFLTVEEQRAILRYLGARVEVYRRNDLQPDGTHWSLGFSLEGLNRDLAAMAAERDGQRTVSSPLKL
jgi:site-specific DNA recombinase